MGLGLFGAVALIRFGAVDAPRLDLEPYLRSPRAPGLFGDGAASLVDSVPVAGILLAAISALLLFLLLDGLIRKLWAWPNEAAALLFALLFAAAPAQAAPLRIFDDGAGLAAGLAVVFLGGWLALMPRRGLAFPGAALGALAPALHPVLWGLTPGIVFALAVGGHLPGLPRRLAGLSGVLLVASVAALAGVEPFPSAAHPGFEGLRASLPLAQLAALPVLAVDTAPRALLPTGFEALAGQWPVLAGLSAWGLALGVGCLIAGMRLLAAPLLVALVLLPAPWLVQEWISGDPNLLVPALAPVAAFGALVLGAFRTRSLRMAVIGLCLGLAMIVYLHELRRDRFLELRRTALQLPWRSDPRLGPPGFAPADEPDPARLVLYSRDVMRLDPQWKQVRAAARRRLEEGAPAVDPLRLEDLLASPVSDPPRIPVDKQHLLRRLPELETRLAAVADLWSRTREAGSFFAVAADLEDLAPEVLEFHYALSHHVRAVSLVRRFRPLAIEVADRASRAGLLAISTPLRDAIVLLSPPSEVPGETAILGREYLECGETELALELLRQAVPELDGRGLLEAVSRGALGRALAATGAPDQALRELNAAWGGLATVAGPGGRTLQRLVPVDALGYYLVAEFLLARYELVRELDPQLEEQARRDVMRVIDPTLSAGRRRVPALAIRGRLHALRGEGPEARRLLRELRAIETADLSEQADGPRGRINHPRFRILGLRTLLEVLDPAVAAAEIGAIRREIDALEQELRFGPRR
jgi:hypothetical protein